MDELMTTSNKNPFMSAEQASEFMLALQNVMRQRDSDLRTLGHGKTLHALAEVCGYTNWHSMKSAFDAPQKIDPSQQAKNNIPASLLVSVKLTPTTSFEVVMNPPGVNLVSGSIKMRSDLGPNGYRSDSIKRFTKVLFLTFCWYKMNKAYFYSNTEVMTGILSLRATCKIIQESRDFVAANDVCEAAHSDLSDFIFHLPGMTQELLEALTVKDSQHIANIPQIVAEQFGYLTMALSNRVDDENSRVHEIPLSVNELKVVAKAFRPEIRHKFVSGAAEVVTGRISESIEKAWDKENDSRRKNILWPDNTRGI
jgi:hypothetical protein